MLSAVTRSAVLCALLGALGACQASSGPQPIGPIGEGRHGVCVPGNMGGDVGCACTDNSQCTGFDEDARLIVCDVPAGMTVGTCTDCTVTSPRPVGCFCSADTDCASAHCNGRTCQTLLMRGEFCSIDSDCGTDMLGAMICLPTKHWCGPLPEGSFCDFQSDCLSGICNGMGLCSLGGAGGGCSKDTDCTAPLVCSMITFQCIMPQADGAECARNAECQNQCNSFSGLCMLGGDGVLCTTTGNPAGANGDCTTGFTCTTCGPASTCRMAGEPCG